MWIYLTLFVLVSGAVNAQGVFYTYLQWERLSDNSRVAYISGAADTLGIMTDDDGSAESATKFRQCLQRTKITNKQLSDNVRAYGAAHPEDQSGPVQVPLIKYVNALCK